ncbi:Putative cytoplasmic protein [Salmonella enterica subsp. enterica serovar Inverness str. R8-3668]|uniref:Putative cytoplasmic protein n=1 Tax=Salmonella enterica subsp. enterica serovar Inverness str. R8-3668 TaxID=913075 RepID=G5NK08_SALET|nr:Putative cytoplasmic protein [Salmonella enterica subsp. enterica serovar Inverness str. R8-3668]
MAVGFIKNVSIKIAIAQKNVSIKIAIRDRAIVLAKGGEHWFYTFLYAKQDMANISYRELAGFRELAKHYAWLTEDQITALINNKELVEVRHVSKN